MNIRTADRRRSIPVLPRAAVAFLTISLLCIAILVLTGRALAHHSAAMYDDKQSVTVVGTVSKFEWANPHVYIFVHQPNQQVDWEVECSPPSILSRLGWSPASFHYGDVVTVVGMPARDPGKRALLPQLIKRGDAVLFERKVELTQLAQTGAAPPAGTKPMGLEGVWATQLSLTLEKAMDGDNLPLTKKGKTAYKHFDEKTMHPGTECVPSPAPFLMVTPDLKRITRVDKLILIDGEFDSAQRTIHMDMNSHDGASTSIQGHSIGHWEGGSLYIDTALFTPHAMGNGYGVPSGAAKHLTERLTPDATGITVMYTFELTDPEFLSHPVQGGVKWEYRPNMTYAPPKCDPDNARRSFRTH